MARRLITFGGGLAMLACSPAIEWRQLAPPELGVVAIFPCRPASHQREVQLAGQRVRMVLYACKADATTFALAAADVADVRLVGVALQELGAAAAHNVGATPGLGEELNVPGMTPNANARRFGWTGELPGGAVTREQVGVFVRGSRVYQATVLGPNPEPEMVNIYFAGLRFGS